MWGAKRPTSPFLVLNKLEHRYKKCCNAVEHGYSNRENRSIGSAAKIMTVEHQLGYFFFDKQVLNRALTRKAYALEKKQQNQEYEDQEIYRTLGDSVLKTVLVELLIRAGAKTRQEITVKKIELEREEKLAEIGKRIGLGDYIQLGMGERKQNAGEQPYVLAETLEAIIGGVYFDGGFSAARQMVAHLFQREFADKESTNELGS